MRVCLLDGMVGYSNSRILDICKADKLLVGFMMPIRAGFARVVFYYGDYSQNSA
jgi:hypothetical protein